jgi:pyrimidine operon attenuation protein/uracil phosphoribosyltransferase
MNTFKSTKIAIGLMIGLVLTATSVNAQTINKDIGLTQTIITQGKAVAAELTQQLSQSITNELKSFSIDTRLMFIEDKSSELALESTKESKNENKQEIKNKPLTKTVE